MAKVISLKNENLPQKEAIRSAEEIREEIKIHQDLIKQFPRREINYTRLMIIYRKQKEYKKELLLIEKGINIFNKITQAKSVVNKNIIALSKKINKAFGLVDKKGNALHQHEPVAKWEKRKNRLVKIMSK